MKNAIIFSFAIICLLLSSSLNASKPIATIIKWQHIASKKVNFRLDRDVIYVSPKEGRFNRLKLEVTGGSLHMIKMVVSYRNGTKESIQLRYHFNAKSGSRVIDLTGGARFIEDITFWYDSVNVPGRKATIHVFGKHP